MPLWAGPGRDHFQLCLLAWVNPVQPPEGLPASRPQTPVLLLLAGPFLWSGCSPELPPASPAPMPPRWGVHQEVGGGGASLT